MKMIVGLGNPGQKYAQTRHNLGFRVVDQYALDQGVEEWKQENRFSCMLIFHKINSEKIILVKPQTFMNGSGDIVSKLINFYKIPIADILVIHDEFDLPLGTVRFRKAGFGKSSHKGICSIVEKLGTANFSRLRLGIGKDPVKSSEVFVLERFSEKEQKLVESMIAQSMEMVNTFIETH